MKDITDKTDIIDIVDRFYNLVRSDNLLYPIFKLRIEDNDWERHLNRMYDFWNTVLFFKKEYKGNPFSKHVDLPIDLQHFQQWSDLFKKVIDDNYQGPIAEQTKKRVDNMSKVFLSKLDHQRKNPSYRSIM